MTRRQCWQRPLRLGYEPVSFSDRRGPRAALKSVRHSPFAHLSRWSYYAGRARLVHHLERWRIFRPVTPLVIDARGCNRQPHKSALPNPAVRGAVRRQIVRRWRSASASASRTGSVCAQLKHASVIATIRSLRACCRCSSGRTGRIVVNAFSHPQEVSYASIHGGPFPATSDSRFTSVGMSSIERFLRPVCYQGLPDELLPEALQHDNPLGIWRLTDGELAKA